MSSHDSRVTFCSHQDGKQRYPATEIHNRPPKIASWRNNLTALSQYRNLYFVVHLDTIAVFEPDFPNQGTRDPAGTIQLPATRPGLEGYLDEFYPQAANQILVKDLGEEEILLVGNVSRFHGCGSPRILDGFCTVKIKSVKIAAVYMYANFFCTRLLVFVEPGCRRLTRSRALS